LRLPRRRPAACSGSGLISTSCERSVCVDSTTIVSVRPTPSIDRMWLISSSNVEVLNVFTFSNSVYPPVTW